MICKISPCASAIIRSKSKQNKNISALHSIKVYQLFRGPMYFLFLFWIGAVVKLTRIIKQRQCLRNVLYLSQMTLCHNVWLSMTWIFVTFPIFSWPEVRYWWKSSLLLILLQLHGTYRQKDRIYREDIFGGQGKSINEASQEELQQDVSERTSENPLAYQGNKLHFELSDQEIQCKKTN